HAVQGLLSNDEGRPDSAMASLRRALELNPNSLDARNWLALTLVDTGQFRAGLDQLVALLAIDPLYGPAVNNGMLYSEEIGDLEGAKDIARTYIRRSRNPTTTAFYTARIAALEGRVADMIVTLESVPEDSPDTRVAQWLSFGYGWLGEFGAALTVPGLSTDAAMTRQADVGDPVKAVKALSEKLALNPTIVNVQRRYIQALSRSGADQALLKFYQDTYAGDLDIFATRMQGASARSMVQPFKELALAMNATGNLSALPTVMQRWKETIDAFRAGGSRSGPRDIDEAEYWAMSGDVDKSVTLLTQAYEKMSFLAPYDFRDRAFDSLQQDSRFVALRERAREDLNQQRAFMDWPPLDSEFFINRLLLGGQ
ncbi:MAG: tetratricopeptide repeat protein, partial [Congregibacter sp.]|nr:tetratricopeptide repeat protein [Congregibacter sp.]